MKTALLVVDVQQIYTDPESELYCKDANKTVERINKLIEKFRAQKSHIVYIRHIHKQDGSDLGRMFDFSGEPEDDFNFKEKTKDVEFDPRLIVVKESPQVSKNRYSAFAATKLDSILRRERVERVVICGFMTNFCCESTARDAHDRDYHVDFVTDATGTPGTETMNEKKIRETVAEFLESGFSRCMSTRKALGESY